MDRMARGNLSAKFNVYSLTRKTEPRASSYYFKYTGYAGFRRVSLTRSFGIGECNSFLRLNHILIS